MLLPCSSCWRESAAMMPLRRERPQLMPGRPRSCGSCGAATLVLTMAASRCRQRLETATWFGWGGENRADFNHRAVLLGDMDSC